MAKGTLSNEIECMKCGSIELDVPDNVTDQTLIRCAKCQNEIGPYGALVHALEGQGHTVIFGGAAKVKFKPIS